MISLVIHSIRINQKDVQIHWLLIDRWSNNHIIVDSLHNRARRQLVFLVKMKEKMRWVKAHCFNVPTKKRKLISFLPFRWVSQMIEKRKSFDREERQLVWPIDSGWSFMLVKDEKKRREMTLFFLSIRWNTCNNGWMNVLLNLCQMFISNIYQSSTFLFSSSFGSMCKREFTFYDFDRSRLCQ